MMNFGYERRAYIAKQYDNGDIAAEMFQRYPDDVREILADLIEGKVDKDRIDGIAQRALYDAVEERYELEAA